MKRQDAIDIVRNRYKNCMGITFEDTLVDILSDLGILKLDWETPSPYHLIREVVGDDFMTRDTARLVLDHLFVNGYEVKKTK